MQLESDVLIRSYLEKQLRGLYISTIDIERGKKALRIVIKTSRPGLVIGRSGEGIQKTRKNLEKFIRKHNLIAEGELKLDVEEVRNAEADANIVAQTVAEGLERRLPFRRVLKQTAEKVMANRDVKGIRITLGGRLGGADMARKEQIRKGRVPLQTFRADVDYSEYRAMIPQGVVGIKVWIYRGDIFSNGKKDNN